MIALQSLHDALPPKYPMLRSLERAVPPLVSFCMTPRVRTSPSAGQPAFFIAILGSGTGPGPGSDPRPDPLYELAV
jgi:hypothetical protein